MHPILGSAPVDQFKLGALVEMNSPLSWNQFSALVFFEVIFMPVQERLLHNVLLEVVNWS